MLNKRNSFYENNRSGYKELIKTKSCKNIVKEQQSPKNSSHENIFSLLKELKRKKWFHFHELLTGKRVSLFILIVRLIS